jgi:hypothetical protein
MKLSIGGFNGIIEIVFGAAIISFSTIEPPTKKHTHVILTKGIFFRCLWRAKVRPG